MSKDDLIKDVADLAKYKFQSCAGTLLPTQAARKEIERILDETVLDALRKGVRWDARGRQHIEHVACRIARKARSYARKRRGRSLGYSDVRRAANKVIPKAVRTLERAIRLSKSKKEEGQLTVLKRYC